MAEFILKDWYGKKQIFDKETIYVQGKDGELMPFTHGAGNPIIEPLNVTENGTYSPQAGVDGYGPVVVNVPDVPAVVRSLEVTENGTYTPPEGVDGYSPVTVAVPAPEIKLQEKTATVNGTYTADSGFDGLGKVLVNVAASGGTVVAKKGTFTGNGSYVTFNHNLGVVPSVIFCYPSTGISGMSSDNIGFAIGMNQEIASQMGLTEDQQYGLTWNSYANDWGQTTPDYPIESASSSSSLMLFSDATATSIRVGSSSYKTKNATGYTWYAFGIQED